MGRAPLVIPFGEEGINVNGTKALPREPWRGSMICGYQVAFGDWTHAPAWCAERKADGSPVCEGHHEQLLAEDGEVRMACDVALGAPQWALRLLWEPEEGSDPAEPSYEEMALYAPVLGLVGGE
jgi:hypothetical protein